MTTASIKETIRHYRDIVTSYEFQGLEKLWQDFNKDIEQFREGKP